MGVYECWILEVEFFFKKKNFTETTFWHIHFHAKQTKTNACLRKPPEKHCFQIGTGQPGKNLGLYPIVRAFSSSMTLQKNISGHTRPVTESNVCAKCHPEKRTFMSHPPHAVIFEVAYLNNVTIHAWQLKDTRIGKKSTVHLAGNFRSLLQ